MGCPIFGKGFLFAITEGLKGMSKINAVSRRIWTKMLLPSFFIFYFYFFLLLFLLIENAWM